MGDDLILDVVLHASFAGLVLNSLLEMLLATCYNMSILSVLVLAAAQIAAVCLAGVSASS
jgi:hypothetical protein